MLTAISISRHRRMISKLAVTTWTASKSAPRPAIRITASTSFTLTPGVFRNGRVRGNKIKNFSGHGIGLNGAIVNSVCSDNTIEGSDVSGIVVQDIPPAVARDLVLTGNIITNCVATGLHVLRANYITVVGNKVRSCADGIVVQDGGYNQVCNNFVRSNAGYGIRLRDTTRNLVNSNYAVANDTGIADTGTTTRTIAHDNFSVGNTTAAYGTPGSLSDYTNPLIT